jgi:hypothetical protein
LASLVDVDGLSSVTPVRTFLNISTSPRTFLRERAFSACGTEHVSVCVWISAPCTPPSYLGLHVPSQSRLPEPDYTSYVTFVTPTAESLKSPLYFLRRPSTCPMLRNFSLCILLVTFLSKIHRINLRDLQNWFSVNSV